MLGLTRSGNVAQLEVDDVVHASRESTGAPHVNGDYSRMSRR
jgi:hypothetical protein